MRDEIKVRIQIYKDYKMLHDVMLPISDLLTREAMQPIDFPSKDADPLVATLCCTPKQNRLSIIEFRQQLAKALTEEFMRFFSQTDTEMGYPKDETS